ncbi:MAG: hypothetical protein KF734_04865 [Saprospiraceae bacterium]|nr:hypothetical protein [Saprospiraceae bacterium]
MEKSEFQNLVERTIKSLQEPTTSLDDLFDELAKLFLWHGMIKVGDVEFKIVEVEFYLNNKEENFDPYAHFHNSYPTGSFRLHDSGSGFDVSIEGEDFWGGVLIRGIRWQNSMPIDGPFKTLMAILSEIKDFEKGKEIKLLFSSINYEKTIKITNTSRVGLKVDEKKLERSKSSRSHWERYLEIGWRYHIYEQEDPKKKKPLKHIK